MTDDEIREEELKLVELNSCIRSSEQLIAEIQSIPASFHLHTAKRTAQNLRSLLCEERRVVAGRIMRASQADPEDLP